MKYLIWEGEGLLGRVARRKCSTAQKQRSQGAPFISPYIKRLRLYDSCVFLLALYILQEYKRLGTTALVLASSSTACTSLNWQGIQLSLTIGIASRKMKPLTFYKRYSSNASTCCIRYNILTTPTDFAAEFTEIRARACPMSLYRRLNGQPSCAYCGSRLQR